jgi:hypothetical protein
MVCTHFCDVVKITDVMKLSLKLKPCLLRYVVPFNYAVPRKNIAVSFSVIMVGWNGMKLERKTLRMSCKIIRYWNAGNVSFPKPCVAYPINTCGNCLNYFMHDSPCHCMCTSATSVVIYGNHCVDIQFCEHVCLVDYRKGTGVSENVRREN